MQPLSPILTSYLVRMTSHDVTEIKKVKKELETYLEDFKNPGRRKEMPVYIEAVITAFPKAKTAKGQTALINSLEWPIWDALPRQHQLLADFILKALENSNGSVRQAGVRLSKSLCSMTLALDQKAFPSLKTPKPEQIIQDKKILINLYKTLISQAKKEDANLSVKEQQKIYVDDLKPSLYKSYQLAAYAVAYRNQYTEKVLLEAGLNLDEEILPYRPFDEFYDNDPAYENPEYFPPSPPQQPASQSLLTALEHFACTNLLQEAAQIGGQFSMEDCQNVVAQLQSTNNRDLQSDFFVMSMQRLISTLPREIPPTYTNGFVRGFQFLSNCLVQTDNEDGTAYSNILLITIGRLKTEFRRKQPADYDAFIMKLLEAQQAIAQLGQKFSLDFVQQSIIRHILFWYTQSLPWGFTHRTAKQLVAISWCCLDHYNTQVNQDYFSVVSTDRVAQWAGWKKGGSLSSATRYGPFRQILYALYDPMLLSVNPDCDFPDWFERLQELVPGLESNFDDLQE